MPMPPGLEAEPLIRLAAFVGVFVAVAMWEITAPRRTPSLGRRSRWPGNLALLATDVLAVRVLAPGAAIALAIAGEAHGWGLLQVTGVPAWLAIPAAVILLDLALWFQHVVFHAVPLLWRLHRVHHTDVDVDVTTGTRFHPIEILISTGIKCAAVVAIGAPALAVLAFEVILNATSMFNHANARLPVAIDGWLRLIVVTPDMHRVHHSVLCNETNSNFGFALPWWDRVFGTYRAHPAAGHLAMALGVDAFRTAVDNRLDRLLTQPFRDTAGSYAINRRPESVQQGMPGSR